MSEYLIYLCSIFLFLLSRILIIKYFNFDSSTSTGDCIGHLSILKNLHLNKGKVKKIDQYIFDTNDYPNGFHIILYLTKLPISFFEKYGCYIPTFFDLLLLVSTCIYTHFLGGEYKYWLLIFPFILLLFQNDGRAYYLGERSLGSLLGSLYLVTIECSVYDFNIVLYFLGFLLFALTSITSKFALQAICFISIVYSFITFNFIPTLILIIYFALSHIFTFGYSTFVLKGHLRHCKFVLSRIQMMSYYKSSVYDILLLFKKFSAYNITKILFYNPFFLLFTGFTIIPLFLIHFPINNIFLFYEQKFVILVYCGIFVTLIISIKYFKFLGEPERYLEFIILPLFILTSYIPFEGSLLILFILCLTILMVLIKIRILIYNKSLLDNAYLLDQKSLLNFTSKFEESVFLCIDLRLSFLVGYYNSNLKFVNLIGNIGHGFQEEYAKLVPIRYPYPCEDLDYHIKKYKINYICVRNKSLSNVKDIVVYDFTPFQEVFHNNNFSVYETNYKF